MTMPALLLRRTSVPATTLTAFTAAGVSGVHHHAINGYRVLKDIVGVYHYLGRVLASTQPGDVVLLPAELQPDFPFVLAHLRRVGLNPTDQVIWSTDPAVAAAFPEHELVVFLFGDEHHEHRPDEARLVATRQFNSKNWFLNWCLEHGYPIPRTRFFRGGETPRPVHRWRRDHPAFVKGDVAASGEQVIACENWSEVEAAVASLEGDSYQIQTDLRQRAIYWLNVQYHVLHGQAQFVATTVQRLIGNAHAGNVFPAPADPRHLTDRVAADAALEGLQGVIAFDVPVQYRFPFLERFRIWQRLMVTLAVLFPALVNRLRWVFKLLECNPRPNGSTYFTIPANRLGATEWCGTNITFCDAEDHSDCRHTLADFDWTALSEIEFTLKQGWGFVLVNWGPALEGKVGVLLIGTPAEQNFVERRLTEILP